MTPDNWNSQRSNIASFFDGRVQQHGVSHLSCDWGRRESQLLRFRVMLQSLKVAPRAVLDVGCGLADFADVLAQQFPDARYCGVDLSNGMVEAARQRRPDLDVQCLDILERDPPNGPYDLVVASGIFSLLRGDAAGMMNRLLARMFEITTGSLVFTSLSAWAPDQDVEEFRADPLAVADFCRKLSPLVALRHDYLPHDFTLAVHKPQ